MLSFKILTDNRIGTDCRLMSEHGLSIYIQYGGLNILCDTGASGIFIPNAADMGIQLSDTDLCFISHGHSDHTGGVENFLMLPGNNCKVYLSGEIGGKKFYSSRRGQKREIGTDPAIFERHGERLQPVWQSQWIAKDIAVVKIAHNLHPRPSGNIFLSASSGESEFPDNFSHELALAIKCGEGIAIFSPCTHSGIFNAIESCLEFTGGHNLLAFVGGLHLVDGCESEDEIASIAKYFTDKYPHAKLYTGHCTCDSAIKILEKKMGPGKFIMFATGDHYLLP